MINTNNPMLASYASNAQTQAQTRPAERASGTGQGSSEANAQAASVEVSISQEALQAQQADAARQANAQSATGNDRQVNGAAESADARNETEQATPAVAANDDAPEPLADGQQRVGVASNETLG
ncbi:MAG: hypothetical protein ACX931_06735 [Saccharospirillum sp.]